MRLGRSVAQTPAHAPSTDARRVSITSTRMGIEMEGSAFGESLEQEERYNPFQGIDGLGVLPNWFGVSPLETEDTGGALQPAACLVAPSARGKEDGDYPY